VHGCMSSVEAREKGDGVWEGCSRCGGDRDGFCVVWFSERDTQVALSRVFVLRSA
jgi:hypothetical protein